MTTYKKLYKVTFIQYTNSMNDTVSNGDYGTEDLKYINAKELVVTEDDLNYIRKFGEGIDKAEFVGYLFNKRDES